MSARDFWSTHQIQEGALTDLFPRPSAKAQVSRAAIKALFPGKLYRTAYVLGFDIYQYSQFAEPGQSLVPILVQKLLNEVRRDICIRRLEPFLFQHVSAESEWDKYFAAHFNSTGDGGLWAFPTPLHALTIAAYLEGAFRMYNSGRLFPAVREVVGEVVARYAIAGGKIFEYQAKDYGEGLIQCSRILSRDQLNRFLIDGKAHEWFLRNCNGIDALELLSVDRVRKLEDFAAYELPLDLGAGSMILRPPEDKNPGIRNVFVLKIGDIKVKATALSIYNVHLQLLFTYSPDEESEEEFLVTLGNLNAAGLTDPKSQGTQP